MTQKSDPGLVNIIHPAASADVATPLLYVECTFEDLREDFLETRFMGIGLQVSLDPGKRVVLDHRLVAGRMKLSSYRHVSVMCTRTSAKNCFVEIEAHVLSKACFLVRCCET